MKKEKQNRTHRKEVQFNEEELHAVHSKAVAAGLQDAVFIREAALDHELKAALTQEERTLFHQVTSISSRFLNNLNQLTRLANMYKMSKDVARAILDFIRRADCYFRGEEYEPIDTFALELQLKGLSRSLTRQDIEDQERASMKAEIQQLKEELDKKNKELYNAQWWYTECFYFTRDGEDKLKKDHRFFFYQGDRDGALFIKQEDEMALRLPDDLALQYHHREKSLKDLYEYYLSHKD